MHAQELTKTPRLALTCPATSSRNRVASRETKAHNTIIVIAYQMDNRKNAIADKAPMVGRLEGIVYFPCFLRDSLGMLL